MTQTFRNNKSIVDPLEAAAKQFDSWRATRGKRGPIPEQLWELAVSLIDQYSFTTIIRKLRLSGRAFKKRLKPEFAAKKTKTMKFIDFSHQVSKTINPFETTCSIEFTCKNASDVKLTGLSSAEIQNVISLLLGHC
jgi:hypothetical protein